MPTIGEGKTRFGRSYVFLNPSVDGQVSGTGTWRLTNDDLATGTDSSDLVKSAQVAAGSPAISEFQLIYIDATGKAALADASAIATGRVAGITTTSASAGAFISYTRNQAVSITNVNTVVDGATSGQLEVGKYYWLSSTNPGNLTRTPDTTTAGAVVVQVGLATSANEFQVEIQTPVVI